VNIRPIQPEDLDRLADIDGTIESERYLHLDRSGEGFAVTWKLEDRNLREKLIERNAVNDDQSFVLRQIVTGADEGIALLAEHDDQAVAMLVAQPQPPLGTMKIVDLRVDYDFRRQGLATAMVYQIIQQARDSELRAVTSEARTNNFPANQMLVKLGFDLGGVDTQRHSNHDLVKEAVTLFWYAALT
jgi:ribosomal protein S18 acetylase RimI-like enzyme